MGEQILTGTDYTKGNSCLPTKSAHGQWRQGAVFLTLSMCLGIVCVPVVKIPTEPSSSSLEHLDEAVLTFIISFGSLIRRSVNVRTGTNYAGACDKLTSCLKNHDKGYSQRLLASYWEIMLCIGAQFLQKQSEYKGKLHWEVAWR